MRRINDFHVLLVVNMPDLIRKWLVVVDEPVDLILHRTDSHGVGHTNGKRMMKLHLLLDIFQMLRLAKKSYLISVVK